MPDTPAAEDPKIFGFVVRQAEDGRWLIAVTGETPWYVSGFKSSAFAHKWIRDYLTTMSDNNQRLHVEIAQKNLEHNDRLRLLTAEMLAHTTTKGKAN
jgi:hypothetical protein